MRVLHYPLETGRGEGWGQQKSLSLDYRSEIFNALNYASKTYGHLENIFILSISSLGTTLLSIYLLFKYE
jgi:hypothetical protein